MKEIDRDNCLGVAVITAVEMDMMDNNDNIIRLMFLYKDKGIQSQKIRVFNGDKGKHVFQIE